MAQRGFLHLVTLSQAVAVTVCLLIWSFTLNYERRLKGATGCLVGGNLSPQDDALTLADCSSCISVCGGTA